MKITEDFSVFFHCREVTKPVEQAPRMDDDENIAAPQAPRKLLKVKGQQGCFLSVSGFLQCHIYQSDLL